MFSKIKTIFSRFKRSIKIKGRVDSEAKFTKEALKQIIKNYEKQKGVDR